MNRSIALTGLLLSASVSCGPPQPSEWVRAHAVPIESEGPLQDLEPLRGIVGQARLVALGQPSDGTHEAFETNGRLAELLTAQLGFGVVAIQASPPDARAIDAWVQGGEVDPRQALAETASWALDNQEMLDFLTGIRERNASGGLPVRIAGFGFEHSRASRDVVRDFLARIAPDEASAAGADLETAYEAIALGSGQESQRAEVILPAEALVGKHARCSGMIKAEGVEGGTAGLSWSAFDAAGTGLLTRPMEGPSPSGTTGWIRYDLEMSVPEGTHEIRLAMILSGSGTAWFDGMQLRVDNAPYAPAGIDLDFESEGASKALKIFGADARSGVTRENSQVGESSLKLVEDLAAKRSRARELLASSRTGVRNVLQLLESRRGDLPPSVRSEELDWVLHNARAMEQTLDAMDAGSFEQSEALPAATLDPVKESRERSLAENVQWIVDHSAPGTKVVVWTHNLHASRRKGRMGRHLADKYGAEFRSTGFAFQEGAYRALGPTGLAAQPAQRPPDDSVEAALHAAGLPSFFLDLGAARSEPSSVPWLTQPRPFRAAGPRAAEEQFSSAVVAEEFDVLVYVARTTPAIAVRK